MVTLGYLGATQIAAGSVEEACATRSDVLEVMEGLTASRRRDEDERMTRPLEIKPIGTVVGGRVEPTDDHWSGTAIIRLNPDFPVKVVQGLEEFSHLLVVWHFHEASPNDVALHARSPRNNPVWPPTGTFVHRNHRRPNQLAQSFPRLLKVDGLDLHVTDLDAIDGSPVFDLSPYFKEMGPSGEVREPDWPGEMLAGYWGDWQG